MQLPPHCLCNPPHETTPMHMSPPKMQISHTPRPNILYIKGINPHDTSPFHWPLKSMFNPMNSHVVMTKFCPLPSHESMPNMTSSSHTSSNQIGTLFLLLLQRWYPWRPLQSSIEKIKYFNISLDAIKHLAYIVLYLVLF